MGSPQISDTKLDTDRYRVLRMLCVVNKTVFHYAQLMYLIKEKSNLRIRASSFLIGLIDKFQKQILEILY